MPRGKGPERTDSDTPKASFCRLALYSNTPTTWEILDSESQSCYYYAYGELRTLNGEIDKNLVHEFNITWRNSGRKRWEILQDVVAYGLAEYRRRESHAPSALDLFGRAG